MSEDLALLNQKVDRLLEAVEQQQKQMQAVVELKQDLMPIVTSITRIMIDELEQLGEDFQVEDLTFLVKRLLRKNKLLIKTIDRMESLMDLIDEAEFLGRHVFNDTVQSLELLDKKGYFMLARESGKVADRLVSEMKAEDVQHVGDTLLPLMQALRSEPKRDETSLWALFKNLFDQDVRVGLARMFKLIKVLGRQS